MKKFSKKSVLLFAAAMALCAFAMPSMASASSWATIGTEHTLDGANPNNTVGFVNDANNTTSDCSRTQFTSTVVSAAVVEIHNATFSGCTLNGPATGLCTATSTSTNLPWTATARTTSDIQIHGVNIDVVLENHPGGTACGAAGLTIKVTGTITNARWTGNVTHEIILNGAHGLSGHSALGDNQPLTLTGTIRDTQQTLNVN